jgi:hypothetical protein
MAATFILNGSVLNFDAAGVVVVIGTDLEDDALVDCFTGDDDRVTSFAERAVLFTGLPEGSNPPGR